MTRRPLAPPAVTACASARALVEGVMMMPLPMEIVVVISVEVLFVGFGSKSMPLAVTALISGCNESGCTSTDTVANPPLLMVPRSQMSTAPTFAHEPCEENEEMNVAPGGSVSMRFTAWAVETPRFVTTMV